MLRRPWRPEPGSADAEAVEFGALLDPVVELPAPVVELPVPVVELPVPVVEPPAPDEPATAEHSEATVEPSLEGPRSRFDPTSTDDDRLPLFSKRRRRSH